MLTYADVCSRMLTYAHQVLQVVQQRDNAGEGKFFFCFLFAFVLEVVQQHDAAGKARIFFFSCLFYVFSTFLIFYFFLLRC